MSKESLEKIAEKVYPFWKDVVLNLSELKQEKGELVDSQHVLGQPIWLNPLIKIGGNMLTHDKSSNGLWPGELKNKQTKMEKDS